MAKLEANIATLTEETKTLVQEIADLKAAHARATQDFEAKVACDAAALEGLMAGRLTSECQNVRLSPGMSLGMTAVTGVPLSCHTKSSHVGSGGSAPVKGGNFLVCCGLTRTSKFLLGWGH